MKQMKTSQAETIAAARAFLAAGNAEEAGQPAARLAQYQGAFGPIIKALRPRLPARAPKKGWQVSCNFTLPQFAQKYPEQPYTVYVPRNYRPDRPHGLLIFLHGGAKGRGDHAKFILTNTFVNDLLEESGRIVCLPSAPPHDTCNARWQLPEAETHLEDLIEELESRFNIDPDNMILGGSSMGGMGAYHLAHRFADRFSSVLCSSGSWDVAFWPCLKGAVVWLMHGMNDASLFRRRHYTDVAYARCAKARLDHFGVENVYREHAGGHHLLEGRGNFREWMKASQKYRRDPYYPHVVAVTPRGLTAWSNLNQDGTAATYGKPYDKITALDPAPHARWISIDGIGDEALAFDRMIVSQCRDEVEKDWNDYKYEVGRQYVRAGLVEAWLRDDGVIEAIPKNVTGFTIWLHPKMVDFKRVRVIVRGEKVFDGKVQPNLATMLESYKRRRDWGLLYPAKLHITPETNSLPWRTPDQLKLAAKKAPQSGP